MRKTNKGLDFLNIVAAALKGKIYKIEKNVNYALATLFLIKTI